MKMAVYTVLGKCAITGKSVRLFFRILFVCLLVDPVALCLQVPFSFFFSFFYLYFVVVPCRVDNTRLGFFSPSVFFLFKS